MPATPSPPCLRGPGSPAPPSTSAPICAPRSKASALRRFSSAACLFLARSRARETLDCWPLLDPSEPAANGTRFPEPPDGLCPLDANLASASLVTSWALPLPLPLDDALLADRPACGVRGLSCSCSFHSRMACLLSARPVAALTMALALRRADSLACSSRLRSASIYSLSFFSFTLSDALADAYFRARLAAPPPKMPPDSPPNAISLPRLAPDRMPFIMRATAFSAAERCLL